MTNIYDIGDLVRLSGAFTDLTGEPQDPDVVSISVREPDGTITAYVYNTDPEVVKDSDGNYHLDINTATHGDWHYRWYSTGQGQAAGEGHFYIRPAAAIPVEAP
jgi:hypothetical protein